MNCIHVTKFSYIISYIYNINKNENIYGRYLIRNHTLPYHTPKLHRM